MNALNQASLWALLIVLILFALASALVSVSALINTKSIKSTLLPLAAFLASLGGIVLVNLVTSEN